MKRYILICLVAVFCDRVSANETETLEKITIEARPVGSQSLEYIAQPVSILNNEELARKQTNTIGETLSLEPGVTSSDFGQGASRPIIRGLGGPRLQVLQDGIGSLDVSSISADHNVSVNPMQAEQIEIIRGPATLLYGSGNSAGLVNIVNNRIPDHLPVFSARIGTAVESARFGPDAGIRIDGGKGNMALHLDSYYLKTDDYDGAKQTINNSQVETNDNNIGTSYVTENGFMGVSYGRYESIYEIPVSPLEPDEQSFIDLQQNRYDFSGQFKNLFSGFPLAKFRAAYNDYQHVEFEGPGEPGSFFENDAFVGRVEVTHGLINNFSGIAGLQYQQREFNATGDEAFIGKTERDSTGLFVYEDTEINNVNLEFGGRYEHTGNEGSLIRRGGTFSPKFNIYSVSAGLVWVPAYEYLFGIYLSRAQRAPAIEELFSDGPHLATKTYEEGSPLLNEETSNNIDFNIKKINTNWSWNINLFINYIEDFIFLKNLDENMDGIADLVDENRVIGAGDLQLVSYQQDNALFYGSEIETKFKVYEKSQNRLEIRLFGDWVKAKLVSGENLPRISPARIGAGLNYLTGHWQSYLDIVNVFDQRNVAPLETETDGYLMMNAGISRPLKLSDFSIDLFIKAKNLLNEDARRHTSFIKDRAPLPGRSFAAGFKLFF
ncbi:MAG: TonB-dependent receptor [Gammaproteobacteria bacterium]|nr:TonB-dependent receptor [Gammaproteobacteria bacterium]NIN63018.1 TonB-dependent receptor [Gammaproteobacteria bacterium]NIO63313.1 TonB-dependent receptor [Gammaproteobacteria bacterium]NIP50019.1 TonB-dependent receptor [Gammaproteobacteria bacterium]NIQ12238.1 TonB-dependent receptor [Gammaproteobacteria bacterium]